MKDKFRCYYNAKTYEPITFKQYKVVGHKLKHIDSDPTNPSDEGMLTFVNGFWLDAELNLAYSWQDRAIWVPPHRIETIIILKEGSNS